MGSKHSMRAPGPCAGHLARWLLRSGPAAVLHAALYSLLLLRLHPRPLAHTPSFEFSVSFMGAMFGIVAGVAMSPAAHQPGVQVSWHELACVRAGGRVGILSFGHGSVGLCGAVQCWDA
jgi:hypothetical protein